jgi:large subunit ribosomal protein L3|uniref:Large ribosomal subunit protein uL3 n=1 Tax=candidate division WOR-3 bacterium TaxID=2052148 RepID=A0A7C3UQB2_UNCW3
MLLGKKLKMTTIFSKDGEAIPCTIIKAGPCFVVQKRTKDKEGYNALQLGFEEVKKANKPMAGHFQKANLSPLRFLKEFRTNDVDKYQVGDKIDLSILQEGDLVSITGWTKGRGFAGGVKRWGWRGGPQSHGSMSHRRIGSLGSGTFPGHPWKGRTLPGHYGTERVTVKNLLVVKVDKEANLLYVKGATPGPRNGLLLIKKMES